MTATPADRRRWTILGVAVALVIALVGVWWFGRADERRVNAACDTYLEHRGALRNVLSETHEALERAAQAEAGRVEDQYFNDAERTRSGIAQWLRESPEVVGSLDQGDDASRLDRAAATSLSAVAGGFVELESLLKTSTPATIDHWLPEVAARMQNVDDTCLAAARTSWL